MYLVKNTCHDPRFNLALDEYLLTAKSAEFFMLWRNEPSVIIGRNQDALREINLDFLGQHGIHLVRRMSGGGAVFHDLGNINFTYITPCQRTDFFNFERFAAPILAALKALGIDAQASGRNDLTVKGKKFSGNAQHLHKGRLLHHGTLLFNADFGYMQGALNVDPEKLKGKGVASVQSRVTNLAEHCPPGMTAADFMQYIEDYILTYFDGCEPYALTEDDLAAVRQLARDKYSTDEWNLLHMGNYDVQRSARFPAGQVGINLTVQAGRIAGVRFWGDFFGARDIVALEQGLVGTLHTQPSLVAALEALQAGDYISGVDASALAALFF